MAYGYRFIKENMYLSEWGFDSFDEVKGRLREIILKEVKIKKIFKKKDGELEIIENYSNTSAIE